MKKALFLCLLLLFAALSCDEKKKRITSAATGEIYHISVIIDDQLWNGEVGDSIRNKFASPVTGLPQEEPLFTINQYPVKLLEGFMTNSRNIIVVKRAPEKQFKIVCNEFAKPQNVIHISGRNVDEIVDILEKNASEIIRRMKDTEISAVQQRIDTSLLDAARINGMFNISLKIPASFKYAMVSDNFLWLKREIISGNTSILIYEVPRNYFDKSDIAGSVLNMRDSIGALYIKGMQPETEMISERAYAPYISTITLDGRQGFETRGTWELKNDFMSGPFLNFALRDNARDRILVVEGFCYAPSKDKRDLMHELEAIIRTIKFNDNAADAGMENKAF